MKSFIVELWSKVLMALGWVSLFRVIRHFIRPIRQSYDFVVEVWVLGNLVLSITLLSVSFAPGLRLWELVAIIYAAIRIIEIVIYQVNVLLFDEYRARKAGEPYKLRGYRRIVILSLQNYGEIIFWFALIYRNISWAFAGGTLNSFFESLNRSFVTMTTFGQTGISPVRTLGDVLIFLQSGVGLFMAIIVLARVISLLPEPKSLDEFEK